MLSLRSAPRRLLKKRLLKNARPRVITTKHETVRPPENPDADYQSDAEMPPRLIGHAWKTAGHPASLLTLMSDG